MADPHLKKQLEDMAGVWDRSRASADRALEAEKAPPRTGGGMAIFQIRITVPGNGPDTLPVHENFYVIAATRQQAIDWVKIKEGIDEVSVVRELDETEAREFRYLRRAEF